MATTHERVISIESGFSLLELLVALTVISILTASALPQYQEYRKRAYDGRARQDVLSMALAQEAHFLDSEEYLACQQDACLALPGVARISKGTEIRAELSGEGDYRIYALSTLGTGREFLFDSALGGFAE